MAGDTALSRLHARGWWHGRGRRWAEVGRWWVGGGDGPVVAGGLVTRPSRVGMRKGGGGGDGPVMRPSRFCMGEVGVEMGWWLVLCDGPVVSRPNRVGWWWWLLVGILEVRKYDIPLQLGVDAPPPAAWPPSLWLY
jgi:hypothetical protein